MSIYLNRHAAIGDIIYDKISRRTYKVEDVILHDGSGDAMVFVEIDMFMHDSFLIPSEQYSVIDFENLDEVLHYLTEIAQLLQN